jgi:cytoskeleton protein RodZ
MMSSSWAKSTSPGGDGVSEFGDKFRKQREKKGFSIDDVSHVTKIGVRMLQAIEEENFDRLPGGVFNKGFIRTYAKHLGMNDDEAIASYLACVRQTQLAADGVAEPAAINRPRTESPRKGAPAASRKSSPTHSAAAQATTQAATTQAEELPDLQLPRAEHVRPPRKKYLDNRDTGIPWRIVALAGVVIILALIVWNRHSRHGNVQATALPAKSALPAPSATAPAAIAASYQTASAHPAEPGTVAPPNQSTPAVRSPAKHVASAPENASEDDAGAPNAAPLVNSPGKMVAPVTLIIRATENSWISVRADGQEVTAETLIAPAHTSVRAAREIVVKTGNAAGVNFLFNGKEVPAQGAEAEVKTFIFDANGLRTPAPASQPPAQNQ